MQIKQRLLTAAVLIPTVVWCVLSLPTNVLAILFTIFVFAGAWEWTRLVPFANRWVQGIYLLLIMSALWVLSQADIQTQLVRFVLMIACAWWVIALVWIRYPQFGSGAGLWPRISKGVAGLLTLIPAWLSLLVMHGSVPDGPALVLCLLTVIWAADSGAFFAGKRWGCRRLASKVSPGKTWEGLIGGLTTSAMVGLLWGWFLDHRGMQLAGFVALCLAAASFSVVGDLMESLLKRHQGVKDSGRLLPGHGGVLDRVDSLTAAAPVFALGVLWLNF